VILFNFFMSNSMLIACIFSHFGNYQLPFLQGLSILEKLAAPLAPFIVGRTGTQLFLTDGEPSKPPLLLLMTYDHEDKKFM
jgi:hypothetical protein